MSNDKQELKSIGNRENIISIGTILTLLGIFAAGATEFKRNGFDEMSYAYMGLGLGLCVVYVYCEYRCRLKATQMLIPHLQSRQQATLNVPSPPEEKKIIPKSNLDRKLDQLSKGLSHQNKLFKALKKDIEKLPHTSDTAQLRDNCEKNIAILAGQISYDLENNNEKTSSQLAKNLDVIKNQVDKLSTSIVLHQKQQQLADFKKMTPEKILQVQKTQEQINDLFRLLGKSLSKTSFVHHNGIIRHVHNAIKNANDSLKGELRPLLKRLSEHHKKLPECSTLLKNPLTNEQLSQITAQVENIRGDITLIIAQVKHLTNSYLPLSQTAQMPPPAYS